jgi:alpha-mannosidase
VRIAFAAPVIAAREVNSQELPIGKATIDKGELVTSLGRFQPRTFAVKLAPHLEAHSTAIDADHFALRSRGADRDGERMKAGFDGEGYALPG